MSGTDRGRYRLFGRPHGFDVECPRCGLVILVHARPRTMRLRTAKGTRAGGWDPLSSRWKCPSCQKTWTVGLAVWEVSEEEQAGGLPRDQVPDLDQLAQIRQATGAWVQWDRARGRRGDSNRTEECSCPQWEHGSLAGHRRALDPGCRRHGKGGSEPDPGQE